MKKEARLYRRHDAGTVTCLTCQRPCVIQEGRTGWCRTRGNYIEVEEVRHLPRFIASQDRDIPYRLPAFQPHFV